MVLKLTQKERMLLNDQKSHEQICIQKYLKYAKEAFDPALKQLFSNHAIEEQLHLSTINYILAGQVPIISDQKGQDATRVVLISSVGHETSELVQLKLNIETSVGESTPTEAEYGGPLPLVEVGVSRLDQNDIDLCNDMLATEKYVSGSYDTVIFECNDNNVRQALNNIQKEEQEHGKNLSNYLRSKGEYEVVLTCNY